jgi:hypothetical protein
MLFLIEKHFFYYYDQTCYYLRINHECCGLCKNIGQSKKEEYIFSTSTPGELKKLPVIRHLLIKKLKQNSTRYSF